MKVYGKSDLSFVVIQQRSPTLKVSNQINLKRHFMIFNCRVEKRNLWRNSWPLSHPQTSVLSCFYQALIYLTERMLKCCQSLFIGTIIVFDSSLPEHRSTNSIFQILPGQLSRGLPYIASEVSQFQRTRLQYNRTQFCNLTNRHLPKKGIFLSFLEEA